LLFASIPVAAVVVVVVIAPRVGNFVSGAAGIHDVAALPDELGICGRSWEKDEQGRALTLTEIRADVGVEPVVVDPAPFAPCPAGPCTRVAQDGPCHPVIYVRVGLDAYLAYVLRGGP
jgi:hypothetical protein